MKIITLTTDFGLRDGYVGVMKGVIWGICSDVRIVDITHHIPPQDINQGGIALQRIIPYFPANTIHIAVVDPGVGTNRKPIAAKVGSQFFVCPDNGLLSRVVHAGKQQGQEAIFFELNKSAYWLSEISHVFHGRDIFAPVGAHLASGVPLSEVGTPISDPILSPVPQPRLLENKIIGEVISIDNFGNLATNIMDFHLDQYQKNYTIKVKDTKINDIVKTFGERPQGNLVGLIGTQKDLMIASVNANAYDKIKASVGSKVEIFFD